MCKCMCLKNRTEGDVETQKGDDYDHDINKINDPASLSMLLPLISIIKSNS